MLVHGSLLLTFVGCFAEDEVCMRKQAAQELGQLALRNQCAAVGSKARA